MEHLLVNLSTRTEEETDPLTQAITKTTYGKVGLYWDNQLISESPEQQLSRIVETPATVGGGMPGGF